MTWFTRITRFGDVHMVFSQEASDSCGIACVRMVLYKTLKLKLDGAALTSERNLYTAYSKVTGAPYDGSAYSDARFLSSVLNKYGSGGWDTKYYSPSALGSLLVDKLGVAPINPGLAGQVVNTLSDKPPVILLVGWASSGAHFVVVDTIHQVAGNYYASVCDPWDGDVHITRFSPNQGFVYQPRASPFALSLGAPEHQYGRPSSGQGNGWVISH